MGTPSPHCALWAGADGRTPERPPLSPPTSALGIPSRGTQPSIRLRDVCTPTAPAPAPPAPPAAAVTPHRDPKCGTMDLLGLGASQQSAQGCGCPQGEPPPGCVLCWGSQPCWGSDAALQVDATPTPHPVPERRDRESRAARPKDLYVFN